MTALEHFIAEAERILGDPRLAGFVRATALVLGSFLFGRLLGAAVGRMMRHAEASHRMLARRITFWAIVALGLVSAMNQLGFKLSVFLGAAGVLTVALGFASQTSASNLISGLFLIGERPFVVGDVVRVGEVTGEVLSIDLMSVKLRTFDNLFVRVPNETLIKSQIVNLTHFPIRRIDLPIGIAYKEDVGRVRDVLLRVADDNPLCLEEPRPLLMFLGFGDSSQDLQFSIWARRESFLELKTSNPRGDQARLRRRRHRDPLPARVRVRRQRDRSDPPSRHARRSRAVRIARAPGVLQCKCRARPSATARLSPSATSIESASTPVRPPSRSVRRSPSVGGSGARQVVDEMQGPARVHPVPIVIDQPLGSRVGLCDAAQPSQGLHRDELAFVGELAVGVEAAVGLGASQGCCGVRGEQRAGALEHGDLGGERIFGWLAVGACGRGRCRLDRPRIRGGCPRRVLRAGWRRGRRSASAIVLRSPCGRAADRTRFAWRGD